MFLAIFNDTYSEIKDKGYTKKPIVGPYIYGILRKIFVCKPCQKAFSEPPNFEFRRVGQAIKTEITQGKILENFFEILNEPTKAKLKK